MARPTKLTDEIVEKANSYLDTAKDDFEALGDKRPTIVWHVNLPSIEGLANYLGIHKDTLYEWEKINDQFSDVLTRVRQAQAERLINKGLSGAYNPSIAKVLLTKHGYIEKSEVDQNVNGNVTFLNDVPRPKRLEAGD